MGSQRDAYSGTRQSSATAKSGPVFAATTPTVLAMTDGNCVYEPMAVRFRDTLERNRRATKD